MVRITAYEQRLMRTAITDAEGRYSVGELPAGRYSLNVTRNGYVSLNFGQQRAFEPGKPLELADAQVADKIDFALPRGGVIAGRVTDESGEPIAGVGVRALRYQYQPDGRRRLTTVPTGGPFGGGGSTTDDLGQFRIYGLMPGTYVISASINPMGGAIAMPMPAGGMNVLNGANDGSDGYATTYFPGTANENDAQGIPVNVGQEAAAFFSLVPARLSRISGVVRNSQGRPASGVTLGVRMMQPGGIAMGGFGGTTGPDGSFMLQNITPGEYVLEVRPMGRPGMPGFSAAEAEFALMPITVNGQDISGLVITTGLGATVTGRVIFDTTHPAPQGGPVMNAPGQSPRVMFQSSDPGGMPGMMGMMGMTPDNGVVDASGRFQLTGIAGKGLFRVMNTPSATKSVMLQGDDITDLPHEVKPGANLEGLEIVLTNLQTTVNGTVRNVRGETVNDYVVAVFPSNLREGTNPGRFIRTVRPDQQGNFVTKGLPPADYYAVAIESLEQGEQWDPAFQDRVRPRAKAFRLNEGQTLSLDLQLMQ